MHHILQPALVEALRIKDWASALSRFNRQPTASEKDLPLLKACGFGYSPQRQGHRAGRSEIHRPSPFPQDYRDWIRGSALLRSDNPSDGVKVQNDCRQRPLRIRTAGTSKYYAAQIEGRRNRLS